ncbi:hypothetical protein H5410_057922 [Solanum commersonii]|uniref:Uncharacterized protein n=1 Tax=Solanum commersonii TaxID=4109 RepID=A0A9J5WRL7_SOLCO|nr:hypothetical protein H5410_057922 [Solanum commersonii]
MSRGKRCIDGLHYGDKDIYEGSKMRGYGDIDDDITHRIGAAWMKRIIRYRQNSEEETCKRVKKKVRRDNGYGFVGCMVEKAILKQVIERERKVPQEPPKVTTREAVFYQSITLIRFLWSLFYFIPTYPSRPETELGGNL